MPFPNMEYFKNLFIIGWKGVKELLGVKTENPRLIQIFPDMGYLKTFDYNHATGKGAISTQPPPFMALLLI
uniref:Putative ovule protein n=1 Tax=Solanum chacoense TaxID=4108 RepID=A0A0V0GP21_SOLCH